MADYYVIVTNMGMAKIAAQHLGGPAVEITHLAVGDNGGADFTPLPTQVELVNEVWRGVLNKSYVSPNNSAWAVFEALIPASDGGWYIREVGLFDAAGDLIAVGKYPVTLKPALGSGSEKDLYVRVIIEVTNAASIVQQIDPTLVYVTQSDLDARDWKESVRAATTATIADLAAGAPDTVDGVTVSEGDRILVKNQTDAIENGIYRVVSVGTGADGAWVRSGDADNALVVTANLIASVEEGTVNADTIWMCTSNAPIAIGTTALTFKRIVTETELDAHTALTAPHSATSAATASRLMLRDSAGRCQTADPAVAADVATLATVTTHAAVAATDTAAGHVELATDAEVQAGTDTDRAITPAGLASFAKTAASEGYQKFPGGLVLQWGSVNMMAAATTTVTFPVAFPAAVFGILASRTSNTQDAVENMCIASGPSSLTQFTLARPNNFATTNSRTYRWFAIGN